MLTPSQIAQLFDYVILFKYQSEKLAREAANSRSLDPELKAALVKEQTRRAKDLTRLEKAMGDEIEVINKEVKPGCRKEKGSRQAPATAPRAKRKSSATGKKSKKRAVGTTGSSSSGKNANDSTKRKPGRPRKTAPTE